VRLTAKHGDGTVVVGVGRAIALKATDASDTGDGTGDGIVDVVLAVLGVLVGEELRQLGLDWRLTTKHGDGTVVVGGGRAIALKATDASDTGDDTGDGIFVVSVLAVRVGLRVGERRQLGLEWRFTTKHGGGTGVVVVGRAIALKATDASVDDTGDDTVGDNDADLRLVGLGVAVKSNLQSNLLKRAALASNC